MGALPTAILIGCLNALQWLLWVAGGLLAVLVVTQALRGAADAMPGSNILIAAGLFALGAVSGYAGRQLARR